MRGVPLGARSSLQVGALRLGLVEGTARVVGGGVGLLVRGARGVALLAGLLLVGLGALQPLAQGGDGVGGLGVVGLGLLGPGPRALGRAVGVVALLAGALDGAVGRLAGPLLFLLGGPGRGLVRCAPPSLVPGLVRADDGSRRGGGRRARTPNPAAAAVVAWTGTAPHRR